MSELAECVKTLWGFTKFIFKQILKVSAFYLEKQKKKNIPKKIFFRPLSLSKQKSFVYWPNFQWRFWKWALWKLSYCELRQVPPLRQGPWLQVSYFSTLVSWHSFRLSLRKANGSDALWIFTSLWPNLNRLMHPWSPTKYK